MILRHVQTSHYKNFLGVLFEGFFVTIFVTILVTILVTKILLRKRAPVQYFQTFSIYQKGKHASSFSDILYMVIGGYRGRGRNPEYDDVELVSLDPDNNPIPR